ncbi:DUF4907 domain-containing protein [Pedobacter sp. ASV28]|uniref:DUF4907 domain-containing protein n=1 Tax=Pedobacter sp. ASV28 TaxID=2795123 RepID=UPI0018EBBB0E|nr:DUF4907 domain-containing protein [Pedobacter sp. ASV28]
MNNFLLLKTVRCSAFPKANRAFVALVFSFFCAHATANTYQQKQVVVSQQVKRIFTYQLINSAAGTFGYDVYSNGKLTIHQPTIPGMPGIKGFASKAAAQKVAQLVMKKMAKGEMLPTVTLKEMKQLKAI